MKPSYKQSDSVLRYKMNKLTQSQIVKIYQKKLEFGVKEKGSVQEFMVAQAAVAKKQGEHFTEKYKEGGGGDVVQSGSSIQVPEKIFVCQVEKMRPYHRMDQKYHKMFAKALDDIEKFKNQELKNFSKTTRMVIQLSNELKVVKDVLDNTQTEFDEYSRVQRQTQITQQAEWDVANIRSQSKQTLLQNMIDQNREQTRVIQKLVYDNQGKIEKQINEIKFAAAFQTSKTEELE